MSNSHGLDTDIDYVFYTVDYLLMNPAWREQLFSQKTTTSGLNPLVLPITNAKMLRILDICYRTWERWAEVAETIPQYKLARMQMQKMASEKRLRAPLIQPYQVWVLGKVGEVFRDLDQGTTKIEIAKSIVESNKLQYSRSEFEAEQIRFTSEEFRSQESGVRMNTIVGRRG